MISSRKFIFITVILFIISSQLSFSQSTSYHVRYSINAKYFEGKQQIRTADNGSLIIGKWGQTFDSDSAEIMVIKLNESGAVLWSKEIPVSQRVENFSVCEMADHSIALAVDAHYNIVYNSELFLLKLSCRGEVLWSNRLFIKTNTEKISYPMSLKEGKNGDLILSSYSSYDAGMASSASVCRVDNSGKLVWSKTFRGPVPAPNAYVNYTAAAFYQDNKVIVLGFANIFNNSINVNKQLYAMKLNYDNGAVEDQKSYNYSEFFTTAIIVADRRIHFNAEQLTDKTFALFGIFSLFDYSNFYYYKIIVNSDLSIKQSQVYVAPYYIGIVKSKIAVFPNGETHIFSSNYETKTVYWYATDNANNTIRQKKIIFPQSVLYSPLGDNAFQSGLNRSAYCVNYHMNSRYYIDQTQVENGDNKILPCLGTDTPFVRQLAPLPVSTGAWSWVSVIDNEISELALPVNTIDFDITADYFCAPDKPVLSFKIDGPASVCSLNNTYTYQVKAKSVQWKMDPANYKSFQVVNDSTVAIVFKDSAGRPHTPRLYAFGGDCSPVKDSIDIKVFPGPTLPDAVNVCAKSVEVHVGYWFKSYRWQDGSIDSVYTISKAGRYTVELTTFCNDVITHTIDAFSDKTGIAGNASVCKNDTVRLTAPGGFINYSWTPDYNVYHISEKEIDVYPQKDTFYILSSETTDGCKLKDTVLVSIKEQPVVDLGPDITVCAQEDLILRTNGVFASYHWNTGSVSPSITVVDPGKYTLTVTSANGCVAGDTVMVSSKSCLEGIYFPNAFTPNHNRTNEIFKPTTRGRLESFELIVYNRWGQVVFRTTSQGTGWDGSLNGIEQSAGTYVWMCRYKFINDKTKTAKGTVTVLR